MQRIDSIKFRFDKVLKNHRDICSTEAIEQGCGNRYYIDILIFKNDLKDFIESNKKEYKIEKELIIDKSHYEQNGTNTINIIKKELRYFDCISGFYLGNVIKYLERYKYKHKKIEEQLKDLLKAFEYFEMYSKLFFEHFYDEIKEYYIELGNEIGQNEFIE